MNEVVTPEALEKLKKKLKELTLGWEEKLGGKAAWGSLCHGAVYSVDGKTVLNRGHGACHSWIGIYNTKGSSVILNCHSPEVGSNATPEATRAYLEWLASDTCPFSKYILNKDDLTYGAIILQGGQEGAPRGVALWMCKTMRYAQEAGGALDTWHLLHKGGVNPFLALYVAHHITAVNGATFGYSVATGHISVFGYRDAGGPGIPDLHAALEGKVNFPDTSDTKAVLGASKTIKDASQRIEKMCKPVLKSDGWGGIVTGKNTTGDQLLQEVLAWQEELKGTSPAVGKPKANRKPAKDAVFLDFDM